MLPEINGKFVYVLQVIVHYILMHMNHSLGSVLMHVSQLLRGDVTFYLVSVQLRNSNIIMYEGDELRAREYFV